MKEWWEKQKDNVLMGILIAYVVSLAVVTVDQVFGPWIFLPEMDRRIQAQIEKLESKDPQAQREAMENLVRTKGDFAVRQLIELLKEADKPMTRGNAITALRAITGQDLGDDPKTWIEWFEKHEKEFP